MLKPLNSNKKLFFVLKLTVAVGALLFVVFKIYSQGAASIVEYLNGINISRVWIHLVTAMFLMPISWIIEAFKWRYAMGDVVSFSLIKSFKMVWYGVGVGLLTPSRIGEPLGRMLMIAPTHRAKAGVMAILCAMSQQTATLIFGIIGVYLLSIQAGLDLLGSLSNPWIISLITIAAVVTISIIIGIEYFAQYLNRYKLFRDFLKEESIIQRISFSRKINIISLSLVRYLIFSTQLILLLYALGLEANLIIAYSAVFATYLFASVVPTFALAELGVRVSFAIIIIGSFWENSLGILAATTTLWVLNVALPGIIGVLLPIMNNREH